MIDLVNHYDILREDAVYNFINNTIEESKYCSDVIKTRFDKEFVMIKEDN